MPAGKIKLRLFLEGIEVPTTSAVVRFGVNQPATAQIQIVPIPEAFELKPRTMVQLFYEKDNDKPRILFSGEIMAIGSGKSVASRSFAIHCTDFTSYWDAAKIYFYDILDFNIFGRISSTFAGAHRKEADPLFGPAATLAALLRQRCRSYPNLKGTLSNIIRVLESIGGYHEGDKKTRGISDFFTIAQLRCRLYEQIGASEKDDTSTKLLKSQDYYRYLSALANRASLISIRETMMGLLNVLRYNFVSNPVARYVKGQKSVRTKTVLAKKQSVPDSVLKYVRGALKVFRADGPIPDSSAISAEERSSLPSESSSLLRTIEGYIDEYKKAGGGRSGVEIISLTKSGEVACLKFLKAYSAKYKSVKEEVPPMDRFLTTLFFPDIFFAPPPTCNVLYPEDYTSVSWSLPFLSEPTRLMVTVPTDWMNAPNATVALWGKQYFFAPDVEDIDGRPLSKFVQHPGVILLPHEIHTGPVPAINTFTDIREFDPILQFSGGSILKKIHEKQKKSAEEARGFSDPIPYLQHVTNWMFTVQKYSQRQTVIPARFIPEVVAGLPMLVIDNRLTGSESNFHILGVPMSITHIISQGQASTEIALSYVRRYDEDDAVYMRKNLYEKAEVSSKQQVGDSIIAYVKRALMIFNETRGTEESYKKDEYNSMTDTQKKEFKEIRESVALFLAIKNGHVKPKGAIEAAKNVGAQRCTAFIKRYSAKYKTVQRGTGEKIPFEDQVRPPWVSEIFMNHKISEFYEELLGKGVGSITDRIGEKGEKEYLSVREAVEKWVGDYVFLRSSPSEWALGSLPRTREIATLDELLGEGGFFSRSTAEANWDDVFNEKYVFDITGQKPLPINPKADPRQEKRDAVLKYVRALEERKVQG